MSKVFGILITILSFISTQSFASTINVNELKKVTSDNNEGKSSTATCGTVGK